MIARVVVYETKGQQFRMVQKAIDYREGLIEAFLRTRPGFDTMDPKQRIAFIQSILDHRRELIDLMTYDDPSDPDD